MANIRVHRVFDRGVMKTNGNEPINLTFAADGRITGFCLTKREYFAAMAFQGVCTPCVAGNHNANYPQEAQFKAEMAVRLADALITELNKDKETK
jgi:hypothetical protein